MKELLAKWAELEPEMCRKDFGGYLIMFEGHFHHISTKGDGSLEYRFDSMTIEYALRERIEARGWLYSVGYGFNESGDDRCRFAYLTLNEIHSVRVEIQTSILEALLTAYISALEAEK